MKKFLFMGALGAVITQSLIAKPRLGPTGTYDLEWLKNQRNGRVISLPLAEVQRIVNTELAAHNTRANAMVAPYAVRVDRRDGVDATGQSLTGTMEEVDEYGRARTQTTGRPGEVYFPLRRNQFSAGFTSDFFRKRNGADLVAVLENAQAAHRKALVKEIRDRLFSPFNYDFEDFMTDKKVFNVKGLYNNDGTVPPLSANLASFTGTHSHYLGFTSWTEANFRSLVNTVREHTDSGQVEVHIAATNEGQVRGFASFAPAIDLQTTAGSAQTTANRGLDTRNTSNRFVGRFDGVDVWVKPWVFDNYACAVDVSDPVLGIRHPDDVEDEGLRPIGSIATFPLQSEFWGAEFGIGVRRRGGAAIAQFNSATPGVYVDATNRDW